MAGAVLPFPHVLIVPWLVLFTVFADRDTAGGCAVPAGVRG